MLSWNTIGTTAGGSCGFDLFFPISFWCWKEHDSKRLRDPKAVGCGSRPAVFQGENCSEVVCDSHKDDMTLGSLSGVGCGK